MKGSDFPTQRSDDRLTREHSKTKNHCPLVSSTVGSRPNCGCLPPQLPTGLVNIIFNSLVQLCKQLLAQVTARRFGATAWRSLQHDARHRAFLPSSSDGRWPVSNMFTNHGRPQPCYWTIGVSLREPLLLPCAVVFIPTKYLYLKLGPVDFIDPKSLSNRQEKTIKTVLSAKLGICHG